MTADGADLTPRHARGRDFRLGRKRTDHVPLSTREAALRAGVSERTIRCAITSGRLVATATDGGDCGEPDALVLTNRHIGDAEGDGFEFNQLPSVTVNNAGDLYVTDAGTHHAFPFHQSER